MSSEIQPPEGLASRPITIMHSDPECSFLSTVPKAAENRNTSGGVRFSPGFPPMVPLIPEIDFIKDTRNEQV
jgi:hypothetical protein